MKVFGQKLDVKKTMFQLTMMVIGIVCYTMAVNLFLVGNNIAGGGFTGIATIIHYIYPNVQIGTMVLLMNIPLYIISAFVKGKPFTIKTICTNLVYSTFLNATAGLPTLTYNPIVAAVFGGVIYAVGLVCLVLSNSSTGGTDLINRLLVRKFPNISVGKMSLVVDGTVAIMAIIAFGEFEAGLYAMLTLYACAAFADKITNSFDSGNLCIVVTEKDHEYIAELLMDKIGRSMTKMDGKGMYSKQGKDVYLLAVTVKEATVVKEIIREHDEKAFVIFGQSNEFLGGNFKRVMPI